MAQLIEHGEVHRGQLGVAVEDLTPDLAETMALDLRGGAVVTQVAPRSTAAAAGLQPGDVIVEVNGLPIADAADLRNLVGVLPVGTELAIVLYRDGQELSVDARIGQVGS
jgi:S1-C subfamily serine protease